MNGEPGMDLETLPEGLHRLALPDGRRVLVKRRPRAPEGFFAMEAYGLDLLRGAGQLRVPAVHAVTASAIAIEDLGAGHAGGAAWERAGRGLARLHRVVAPEFGLDRDGWCGDSAQPNTRMADGSAFFAECRLLPQGRRARDAGLLASSDVAMLERLCSHLANLIPAQPASLVHGDLWIANLHACADGELALIDAGAAHYGWAEADLAMLTLFGSPPRALFAAYESEARVDASWRSRAPLYNLYHLLNHLNLFGPGYRAAVRTVLSAHS
jgi:fructosamine-3-kinase